MSNSVGVTEHKYKDGWFMSFARIVITFLFKCLYRPKIIGAENIPSQGKVVLAGNHTNHFDCLLLMSSCKRNIHFLAKDELWKGPKKIIFANLGLIPVNRRQKDGKSLEMAKGYLNNGKLIGVFPEGTIGKPKMLPFKIGAVKMAYDTKSAIIPFAITGKYKLFFNDLKIVFGKPVKITKENLEQENEKLRNTVIKMVGESNGNI